MDPFFILVSAVGGIIGLYLLIFKIFGLRVVGSDEVAVVEKWWSFKGSLKDDIIALHGEAGFSPDLLRGGIHFRSVLMYRIHKYPLITIPQGQIAYVFARDGKPLAPIQTLGSVIASANNFQDVRGFLDNGGQRGPQRGILREGTYAINLAQFIIVTPSEIKTIASLMRQEKSEIVNMQQTLNARGAFAPVVIMGTADQTSDLMGIVTVHDGPPLTQGEIIAPSVGDDHSGFQDPEKFLSLGGMRGKQIQVLTDGTYFINRLFATIELRPKTIVPIGFVGVVVSFYGKEGKDTSGEDYKHGELVEVGCKGVLAKPLMPGKYAFNTDAGKVVLVPTTNIILKWNKDESGAHKYDENLTEVDIITKDAFEPSLPLSVVMHIDYKQAPWVIQRFGDIGMLVNQSLDPLVSAYFKDVAQTKTLIELIQERSAIREKAVMEMREKFAKYNLQLEEVLIGTPKSPTNDIQIENILTQLRERQIAVEKMVTYQKQQQAAESEKSLREAEAVAKQQGVLTVSKIEIDIEGNKGAALASRAQQEANQIVALAKANAEKVKLEGEADASKESNIGLARAQAIDAQVKAYGGAQYRVIQEVVDKLSQAIAKSQVDIVPKTIVNMGAQEGASQNSSSVMDTLLKLITLDKLGVSIDDPAAVQGEAAKKAIAPAEKADKKAAAFESLQVEPVAPVGSVASVAPVGSVAPATQAPTAATNGTSADNKGKVQPKKA